MGNKDIIIPYKVAAAQSMASSFNAARTNIQYMDRVSISVDILSGNATGTFKLQGRTSLSTAELPKSQGPSTEWSDLPSTGQAAPASGSGIVWDILQTGLSEVRVVFTSTGGTGTCDIWVASKRSG